MKVMRGVVGGLCIVFVGCMGAPRGGLSPKAGGGTCDFEKKQAAPLVVDWTQGARGRLEEAVRQGVVVVRVSGCQLEPLWQCKAPGGYSFKASTPRTEEERIDSSDALRARLPTGLARFSAEVERGDALRVQKTVVGRHVASVNDLLQSELSGSCDGATHFVSAVAVGAFELQTASKSKAGGSAEALGAGVSGSHASSHDLVAKDGDPKQCTASSSPPAGCSAPVELDLSPVLPSIDQEALRNEEIKATLEVLDQCHKYGFYLSAGIDLVIRPDGLFDPYLNVHLDKPMDGNTVSCALEIWRHHSVPKFAGPPMYASVPFTVYPPPTCTPGTPGCGNLKESLVDNFKRGTGKAAPLTMERASAIGAGAYLEGWQSDKKKGR